MGEAAPYVLVYHIEIALLFAALMTTRAKLVHAGSWVGEGS